MIRDMKVSWLSTEGEEGGEERGGAWRLETRPVAFSRVCLPGCHLDDRLSDKLHCTDQEWEQGLRDLNPAAAAAP